MGIRDLYWDAGSIVSQDLIHWQRTGQHTLSIVAPIQSFRGGSSSTFSDIPATVSKSYSSAILFSFAILVEDTFGLIVNITDLAFSPAGFAHENDLAIVIRQMYDLKYHIDRSRSSIHMRGCQFGQQATSIEVNMIYALDGQGLAPTSTKDPFSVLPSSTFLSTALRRTFLLLPDRSSAASSSSSSSSSSASSNSGLYQPRRYHPKSGFNSISYRNESGTILRLTLINSYPTLLLPIS